MSILKIIFNLLLSKVSMAYKHFLSNVQFSSPVSVCITYGQIRPGLGLSKKAKLNVETTQSLHLVSFISNNLF